MLVYVARRLRQTIPTLLRDALDPKLK